MRGLTARWAGLLKWGVGEGWDDVGAGWLGRGESLIVSCIIYFLHFCYVLDSDSLHLNAKWRFHNKAIKGKRLSLDIYTFIFNIYGSSRSQSADTGSVWLLGHQIKQYSLPVIAPSGLAFKYWSEIQCHHCGSLIILRCSSVSARPISEGARCYSAPLR